MNLIQKILMILALNGCVQGRHTISERPLADSARGEAGKPVEIREIPKEHPNQEFYVKQKELSVKPRRKQNNTGSLSAVDDPRSYLMPSNPPLAVGMLVDIKTNSNRLDAPAGGSASTEGGDSKSSDKSTAAVEQTLMKALPSLEPAVAKDKPPLIKNFKAEILEIHENGDVLVAYHRRSIRADQASDLLIRAKIPNKALIDRDSITTTQLEEVQYQESQDGEITERRSSNWEDEYTLRMSGFDEAKSKSALALADQRKQVQDAKDKVVTQIKALGTERNTMAKERSDLLEKKAKDEAKIAELETKVKTQEEEIEKLKPKEEEAKLEDGEEPKDKKPAAADAKANPKGPDKKTVAKAPAAEKKGSKTPEEKAADKEKADQAKADKAEKDKEKKLAAAEAKKDAKGAKK